MNYELLKLSKILPTINGSKLFTYFTLTGIFSGRRTLDVYQERLDMARKAQQEQQAEAESQEQYYPENKSTSTKTMLRTTGFNSQPRLSRKEPQLLEVKSAGKLQSKNCYLFVILKLSDKLNMMMDNYSNLQVLLNGEDSSENLANLFDPKARSHTTKHKGNTKLISNTSGPFFHNGESVDEGVNFRPPTTLSHTALSNFVFKKKKIALRNASENDHVYQYTQGRGFVVPTEKTLGLNGIYLICFSVY